MDEQAQYLARNKMLLGTSQISMMSTMVNENEIYQGKEIANINQINAHFENKRKQTTLVEQGQQTDLNQECQTCKSMQTETQQSKEKWAKEKKEL